MFVSVCIYINIYIHIYMTYMYLYIYLYTAVTNWQVVSYIRNSRCKHSKAHIHTYQFYTNVYINLCKRIYMSRCVYIFTYHIKNKGKWNQYTIIYTDSLYICIHILNICMCCSTFPPGNWEEGASALKSRKQPQCPEKSFLFSKDDGKHPVHHRVSEIVAEEFMSQIVAE